MQNVHPCTEKINIYTKKNNVCNPEAELDATADKQDLLY